MLELQIHATMASFYVDSGDPNSDSHVSTPQLEVSLQPLLYIFIIDIFTRIFNVWYMFNIVCLAFVAITYAQDFWLLFSTF